MKLLLLLLLLDGAAAQLRGETNLLYFPQQPGLIPDQLWRPL